MNLNYLSLKIIILSLLFNGFLCGICLDDDISPCRCVQSLQWIMCSDVAYNYSLTDVFQNISNNLAANEKHFKTLGLYNTGITSLEENTFLDITFETINIYEKNLTQIHTNAFGNMAQTVKSLTIECDELDTGQPNYNLFDMLSSFVNIEYISMKFNGDNSNKVPENAFHVITESQTKLSEIKFWSNFKSIGNNSFAQLPNLKLLRFSNNKLNNISSKAFNFSQSSNQKLIIDLSYNELNELSFETGAFLDAKRPLHIDLGNNKLKSLNKNIFCPFFQINQNSLNLRSNLLDCNCRMFWLIKQRSWLIPRIYNGYCIRTGQSIWESEWDCPDSDDDNCEPRNSSNKFILDFYSCTLLFVITYLLM